jgi:hypothetical protein
MLLEMANNEVKRLEEEKKQQEEEEAKAQSDSQSESVEEDASAKPPLTPTAARLARLAAITAGASKPTSTAHATIEVDDASSISAESIDLSAFRASRIRV